jgi:hypothetical protein
LKVAVTFLRRSGIRLVIYLNDLLIFGTTVEECGDAVAQVIHVLESLGFLINFKKSETTPTQCIEYIGLITNSVSMSFCLTDKKISDIRRLCSESLKNGKCSLRHLAKIIGNLNWASYAVIFAQAHFHSLQATFISFSRANNDNLDSVISLCLDVRADLKWWITSADFSSGKPLLHSRLDMRLSSDACLSGWGAVCLDVKTGGPWSGPEFGRHINSLEILAALKALESFASPLSNCTVEIEIDNATVSYINKLGGCRSKDLCDVSLRIANFCEERKIFLTAIFVPGIDNVLVAQNRGAPSRLAPKGFHVNLPAVASPGGPFCVRMEPSTAAIRKLVPTTKTLESARFQLSMEGARHVLFSPVQLDSILPVEADIGRGSICHPILAELAMVPDHNGPRRGRSMTFSPVAGPSHISSGGESSPGTRRFHPSDRLETLRLRFAESGVSEDASVLILSATRKNTNAAYQSAWNFWRNWCSTREKDPLSPSSTDIVNFLAEYSVGRS